MISVTGNAVVTNSLVSRVKSVGFSIKTSIKTATNSVAAQAIIRTGGGSEVYKSHTEQLVIYKDEIPDTYYVMTSNQCSGSPINFFIHYDGDDVQVFSSFNIAGRKASFKFDDDVTNMESSITYIHSVL